MSETSYILDYIPITADEYQSFIGALESGTPVKIEGEMYVITELRIIYNDGVRYEAGISEPKEGVA